MLDDYPNDWSIETDYLTTKDVSEPRKSCVQQDELVGTRDDAMARGIDPAIPNAMSAPVALGDWIKDAQGVETMDYEPSAHSLLLVWDDGSDGSVEPEVSVVADFIDPDIVHVFMNGIPVAEVNGDPDLTVHDVTVVPLSVAELVGLSPA